MLASSPDAASACQVRSLWNRSSVPGRLPLHPPPLVPIVRVSLEERYGVLASLPSYPIRTPGGYTGTHASPRGHTLGRRCHGDNRGKCLMKTLMRIYEAVAVCIYSDTTLSLSRTASCGPTSISSLTQAVADHRRVCSGRGPQYAASPATPRYSWRHVALVVR